MTAGDEKKTGDDGGTETGEKGGLERRLIEVMRYRGLAKRTERSYVQWYRRYVRFHGMTHPGEMGEREVEAYLTHLATNKDVAASTQNQAFNALVFLYRHVLDRPLENVKARRATRGRTLPVVLSVGEVERLISQLEGTFLTMAQLLYGTGLRKMECVRLRVKDIDLENGLVLVFDGKGNKDRSTILPKSLRPELERQRLRLEALWKDDVDKGVANVWLPEGMRRRYPNGGREWLWQWFFPSKQVKEDPRARGQYRRHHVHENSITRALSDAAKRAGISKKVGAHTLRHSFATHLILQGQDVRTVQELLGHSDLSTTMIYVQTARQMRGEVESPLDRLSGPRG
ncbi:MAG: integron integrase [Verrucomicrobiota bacterium]